MYKKRIILKPIAIVFKAASSHVKRLVGERGEWEVEVERLRFFLLLDFLPFFLSSGLKLRFFFLH